MTDMLSEMESVLSSEDFRRVLNVLYDVFGAVPRKQEAELLPETLRVLKIIRPYGPLTERFLEYMHATSGVGDPR